MLEGSPKAQRQLSIVNSRTTDGPHFRAHIIQLTDAAIRRQPFDGRSRTAAIWAHEKGLSRPEGYSLAKAGPAPGGTSARVRKLRGNHKLAHPAHKKLQGVWGSEQLKRQWKGPEKAESTRKWNSGKASMTIRVIAPDGKSDRATTTTSRRHHHQEPTIRRDKSHR